MPISPQYDDQGRWLPKSPYFKWVVSLHRRKMMVQENPKEHGAVLAFCTSCGAAYLLSAARPHSPCHATDPVLTYDLEALFEGLSILAELVRGEAGASDTPDETGQDAAAAPVTKPRSPRQRSSPEEPPAAGPNPTPSDSSPVSVPPELEPPAASSAPPTEAQAPAVETPAAAAAP